MFRPPLTAHADAAALAVAYDDHHRALYGYCRGILHDDDDAEDALQSTMERAFAALQGGRRDIEMRPWLFRIAHNEAVSIIRRRRPATQLGEIDVVDGDLDLVIARRDELRALREDLLALSQRQRSALLMRELGGLGHAEIARALDCSTAAAKEAIAEARRALRLHREGRDMLCPDVRRTLSETDRRRWRGAALRAHLRTCPGCRSFADALTVQREELRSAGGPGMVSGAAALLGQVVTGPIAAIGGWSALSTVAEIAAIKIVAALAVAALATGAAGVAVHGPLSRSTPARLTPAGHPGTAATRAMAPATTERPPQRSRRSRPPRPQVTTAPRSTPIAVSPSRRGDRRTAESRAGDSAASHLPPTLDATVDPVASPAASPQAQSNHAPSPPGTARAPSGPMPELSGKARAPYGSIPARRPAARGPTRAASSPPRHSPDSAAGTNGGAPPSGTARGAARPPQPAHDPGTDARAAPSPAPRTGPAGTADPPRSASPPPRPPDDDRAPRATPPATPTTPARGPGGRAASNVPDGSPPRA